MYIKYKTTIPVEGGNVCTSLFFVFSSLLYFEYQAHQIPQLLKKNYGIQEILNIIKQPYNIWFPFTCTIINEYICYASLLYDTKSYHLGKIAMKRNHLIQPFLKKYKKYKTTIPVEGGIVCLSLVFLFLFTTLLRISRTPVSTFSRKKKNMEDMKYQILLNNLIIHDFHLHAQ